MELQPFSPYRQDFVQERHLQNCLKVLHRYRPNKIRFQDCEQCQKMALTSYGPQKIQELVIVRTLGNPSWLELRPFINLRCLSISVKKQTVSDELTQEILNDLATLPLQKLALQGKYIDVADMRALRRLTHLSIHSCRLPNNLIVFPQNLTCLSLKNLKSTLEFIKASVVPLRHLRQLHLSQLFHKQSPMGTPTLSQLSDICSITTLTSIHISSKQLPNGALQIIQQKNVSELGLDWKLIVEQDAVTIGQMRQLQYLSLDFSYIRANFGYLKHLVNLKRLNVVACYIRDDGAQHLSNFSKMLHLNLNNNKLTAAATTYISNMPQLLWLDIGNNVVEAEGARNIGRLPHLRELHIDNNNIADEGLHFISRLPIQRLFANNNKLTSGCLHSLCQMQRLRIACLSQMLENFLRQPVAFCEDAPNENIEFRQIHQKIEDPEVFTSRDLKSIYNLMDAKEKVNVLMQTGVFRNMKTKTIRYLAQNAKTVTFRSRDVIFRQGDEIDGLYVVVSGEIVLYWYFNHEVPYTKQSTIKILKMCDLRHDDKSHGQMKLFQRIRRVVDSRVDAQQDRSQKKILRKVGSYEVFGELGVLDSIEMNQRSYQARAVREGVLLKIDKRVVDLIPNQEQPDIQQEDSIKSKRRPSFVEIINEQIRQLDSEMLQSRYWSNVKRKRPTLTKSLHFLKPLYVKQSQT